MKPGKISSERVFHRLSKHLEFQLKYSAARRIFNSLLVEFLFPFQNLLILHKNEITNSGKRVVCHLVSRENVNIKTVLGGDGL